MNKKYTINTREVKRTLYCIECPICKKDITGNEKRTAVRNFKKHFEKCQRQKKIKEMFKKQ